MGLCALFVRIGVSTRSSLVAGSLHTFMIPWPFKLGDDTNGTTSHGFASKGLAGKEALRLLVFEAQNDGQRALATTRCRPECCLVQANSQHNEP